MPAEIKELHDYGVTRIFTPEDGQKLGLQGMINEIVAACDTDLATDLPASLDALRDGDRFVRTHALARLVTGLENGAVPEKLRNELHAAAAKSHVPTLGITGTGGAGKSSLTRRARAPLPGSTSAMRLDSRSSRSTRRGASPAARCSVTGSG